MACSLLCGNGASLLRIASALLGARGAEATAGAAEVDDAVVAVVDFADSPGALPVFAIPLLVAGAVVAGLGVTSSMLKSTFQGGDSSSPIADPEVVLSFVESLAEPSDAIAWGSIGMPPSKRTMESIVASSLAVFVLAQ